MAELIDSVEVLHVAKYLQRSEPEVPLARWWARAGLDATLFLAQGFEERGLGVLRQLARANIRLPEVVLGRYKQGPVDNDRFRDEFETLAGRVAKRVSVVGEVADGSWLSIGLRRMRTRLAVLDISALSNSALFPALDQLDLVPNDAALAYSEAAYYRPTKKDWERFKRQFAIPAPSELGSEFDLQPALYGGGHRVALCPNHEGYDTPGARQALLTFLPFKAARLAALLSWADYAKYILVIGRPRLKRNAWRMDVLREVNARYNQAGCLLEAPTFGYLKSLERLVRALVSERVLEEYDVHLSPIGSKLQNVACWILANVIPSISVVLSTPEQYYPKAYTEGIGRSWAFSLLSRSNVNTTLR